MLIPTLIFVIASIFLWALMTVLAVFAYKLNRGYEENPALSGKELWRRASLAGLGLLVLEGVLHGVTFLATNQLTWDRSTVFVTIWLFLYVPAAVVLIVKAFDLTSLWEGIGLLLLFLILPRVFLAILNLLWDIY